MRGLFIILLSLAGLAAVLPAPAGAQERPVALRGIALGMAREEARARLWADTPYHRTFRNSAAQNGAAQNSAAQNSAAQNGEDGPERDVGSSLWNLDACQITRDSITRDACARIEVTYSHPDIGARVMRIALVQTLNPAVQVSDLRDRLVAAHGEPAEESTEYQGFIWRDATRRVLTWQWGATQLEAGLHFYKGDENRTVTLTLTAEDGALIAENRSHLDGLGAGASSEEQLRF